ncbi:hypothetical protein IWQ62_005816 [Dispira parvispora]|uniref:BHLH domain-containing protein n=1 Tax=Dispira parvispora TaxID=1520584 RepID=A0A9W8AJN4_9FUNG|nr:hypothetical protein IWQ62_005816 [Dispira parvispora]
MSKEGTSGLEDGRPAVQPPTAHTTAFYPNRPSPMIILNTVHQPAPPEKVPIGDKLRERASKGYVFDDCIREYNPDQLQQKCNGQAKGKKYHVNGINVLNRDNLDTTTASRRLQRRREQHNRIERKRRDLINQYINELTALVVNPSSKSSNKDVDTIPTLEPRTDSATSDSAMMAVAMGQKMGRSDVLRRTVERVQQLMKDNQALTARNRILEDENARLRRQLRSTADCPLPSNVTSPISSASSASFGSSIHPSPALTDALPALRSFPQDRTCLPAHPVPSYAVGHSNPSPISSVYSPGTPRQSALLGPPYVPLSSGKGGNDDLSPNHSNMNSYTGYFPNATSLHTPCPPTPLPSASRFNGSSLATTLSAATTTTHPASNISVLNSSSSATFPGDTHKTHRTTLSYESSTQNMSTYPFHAQLYQEDNPTHIIHDNANPLVHLKGQSAYHAG